MSQILACTTLLVHDYDTAIDLFMRALRLSLRQGVTLPDKPSRSKGLPCA